MFPQFIPLTKLGFSFVQDGKTPSIQWLFLVPLKGGRWHIIPQLAVYTTYIPLILIAFWEVICYLSPFRGTRNNHWSMFFLTPPFQFPPGECMEWKCHWTVELQSPASPPILGSDLRQNQTRWNPNVAHNGWCCFFVILCGFSQLGGIKLLGNHQSVVDFDFTKIGNHPFWFYKIGTIPSLKLTASLTENDGLRWNFMDSKHRLLDIASVKLTVRTCQEAIPKGRHPIYTP